jgi:hypothetical protein
VLPLGSGFAALGVVACMNRVAAINTAQSIIQIQQSETLGHQMGEKR